MNRLPAFGALMAALLSLACIVGRAADGAPEGGTRRDGLEAELRDATQAAGKVLQRGPAQVKIGEQGSLLLPEHFGYIPAAEGGRVMRAMGNSVGPGFQGLIVPLDGGDSSSFYFLTYESSGYIKDDDAKDWKPDELLQQVRDGTEEGNKRRVQMGIPAVEVTGWVEPPNYQAQKHQLVWSIGSREKGSPPGRSEGINYRTLVLGREGYMTMTLVSDAEHVATLRPATATLLDNLTFTPGKRYADFNAGTDHVAEIGLAALIAGVAAKKLGLLAIVVAFVIKFAKVIILAAAGIGLAMRKKLGLGRKSPPAAAEGAIAMPAVTPPAASPAGPPPQAPGA
jgi:uncharacterized membrane-anchored protein